MAAYDNYRSGPDRQPYEAPYESRTYQPFPSYHQSSHPQDQPQPRSRASSSAHSDGLQPPFQQPLRNALNNAFDKSDSARTVDPSLIAQITAEVKQSVLDEIRMNGMPPPVQPHASAPPQHHVPHSPTSTSASFSSRNLYTPPSPPHVDYASQSSACSDPLAQDPTFDGAADTPTPRHERTASTDVPADGTRRQRPAPVSRMSTDADFTPMEKKWQRLFDAQGQPTARLGQFLRGLANHLIDDYEPKKSIVISPAKMLRFYDDVKLPDEIYPWQTIFGKLPCSTLSKIYRELRCQHHLIQDHPADSPHVPSLTPQGFQEWMTMMIQAYPETEYDRLKKAVLDMPISNADDTKERFPKELPRRLFPLQDNLQAQQRCAAVLVAEGVGPLRKAPTFPPPPPMNSNGLHGTQSGQSDFYAVESDDEGVEPLSKPIERERKPYTAVPGGGKQYEEELSGSLRSDTSLPGRRSRTQSTASQNSWPPNSQMPPYQQHPRANSNTTGRRPRSPPISNYGTRSDSNVRDIPGSYYSTNHPYDHEEENRRFAKDAEMKRADWARRQAEEESTSGRSRRTNGMSDASYDSQPRSVYDDEYPRGRLYSNGYDTRGYDSRRY